MPCQMRYTFNITLLSQYLCLKIVVLSDDEDFHVEYCCLLWVSHRTESVLPYVKMFGASPDYYLLNL